MIYKVNRPGSFEPRCGTRELLEYFLLSMLMSQKYPHFAKSKQINLKFENDIKKKKKTTFSIILTRINHVYFCIYHKKKV